MTERSNMPDELVRLLDFLRGRDVPCPLCGYNLRDLNAPRCPECRQGILLTVGITQPKIVWFLLTVTPCTFSGIAAALLLIPIVVSSVVGGGTPPPLILVLDAFGWLSCLVGVVLIRRRFAFLRQPTGRQRFCAAASWAAHVLAFVAFMATAYFVN